MMKALLWTFSLNMALVAITAKSVPKLMDKTFINIAHRGNSGAYPEHSRLAYLSGIEVGADYIECDVEFTKDRVPVCFHDYWLSRVTDVADKPEFADMKSNKLDLEEEGTDPDWLIWDFTLEQLKTLRLRQPLGRDRNPEFDGQEEIPTFLEYIEIAKQAPRKVGMYVEIKFPYKYNEFWSAEGISETAEDVVLRMMTESNCHGSHAETPDDPESMECLIQSFSMESLMKLSKITNIPLVFLTWKPEGLENIECYAQYLYGIGIWKNQTVPVFNGHIVEVNNLVEYLHGLDLKVHVYTFRNDDPLPYELYEDPYAEYELFYNLGVDGFFTDFPESLARFVRFQEAIPGADSSRK